LADFCPCEAGDIFAKAPPMAPPRLYGRAAAQQEMARLFRLVALVIGRAGFAWLGQRWWIACRKGILQFPIKLVAFLVMLSLFVGLGFLFTGHFSLLVSPPAKNNKREREPFPCPERKLEAGQNCAVGDGSPPFYLSDCVAASRLVKKT
jgi:hypothetical protein